MSNERHESVRDAIERQAADFVLALADAPSEQLREAVAEWVRQAPSHAVAFAKAELAWEEAGRLSTAHETKSRAPGSSADTDAKSIASPKSR